MNKMLLRIEYQTFLCCADQKDEQALLAILGRAFVVKKEWNPRDTIYRINEVPEISMIKADLILSEKPEPEVTE
jgi:hypothetical protein